MKQRMRRVEIAALVVGMVAFAACERSESSSPAQLRVPATSSSPTPALPATTIALHVDIDPPNNATTPEPPEVSIPPRSTATVPQPSIDTSPPPITVVPVVTLAPTSVIGEPIALQTNHFARSSVDVVTELKDMGFAVIDYFVCSSSVEWGEVRQVTTTDGIVLVDKEGVTDDAQALRPGSVVEVKVGNGESC